MDDPQAITPAGEGVTCSGLLVVDRCVLIWLIPTSFTGARGERWVRQRTARIRSTGRGECPGDVSALHSSQERQKLNTDCIEVVVRYFGNIGGEASTIVTPTTHVRFE